MARHEHDDSTGTSREGQLGSPGAVSDGPRLPCATPIHYCPEAKGDRSTRHFYASCGAIARCNFPQYTSDVRTRHCGKCEAMRRAVACKRSFCSRLQSINRPPIARRSLHSPKHKLDYTLHEHMRTPIPPGGEEANLDARHFLPVCLLQLAPDGRSALAALAPPLPCKPAALALSWQWWRRAAAAVKDRRSLYLTRVATLQPAAGSSSGVAASLQPSLKLVAAVICATRHDDRSMDYGSAVRVFALARASPPAMQGRSERSCVGKTGEAIQAEEQQAMRKGSVKMETLKTADETAASAAEEEEEETQPKPIDNSGSVGGGASSTAPVCYQSSHRSDTCEAAGNVCVLGRTQTIQISSLEQEWKVKPYCRKYDAFVLSHVKEWALRPLSTGSDALRCTVNNSATARRSEPAGGTPEAGQVRSTVTAEDRPRYGLYGASTAAQNAVDSYGHRRDHPALHGAFFSPE
nr:unnamed protein product [Digitaria exilis]